MLHYSERHKLFYTNLDEAQSVGFEWHEQSGMWVTGNRFKAVLLHKYADESVAARFRPMLRAIEASRSNATTFKAPAPDGLEYLPFQQGGIEYASYFAARQGSAFIGDEPGLGKTIQAIGVANYLKLPKLLVVCPASLRINWIREIEKWHIPGTRVEAVLSGKDLGLIMRDKFSAVISYDLARSLDPKFLDWLGVGFDMFIPDEAHYLKSAKALRTHVTLGDKKTPGLADLAKMTVLLSGTPIPNKFIEFHSILTKFVPHIIDNLGYWACAYRFCTVENKIIKMREMKRGGKTFKVPVKKKHISGMINPGEMYARLRSSFMVRRLKKDVLKDLPEKRYQLVIFPQTGATSKIIKKEKPFNANEIINHGVPVGSALPELRKEMGLAKTRQVLEYLENLLSGVSKVIVFAHHREVVGRIMEALADYRPVCITGSTLPQERQAAVDAFQHDPAVRVFVGNIIAAGVGHNLTASSNVVFAEVSWVPGENEQASDRCHRIGQTRGVNVHYLVVEESLDARIMSSAALKQDDITNILDGG